MKKIALLCFLSLIMQTLSPIPIKSENEMIPWKSEEVHIWAEEELNIMAKAIYGEARGETYMGKVAVGAVIINRVKSSRFPNTILEVIYEPGAFTCVEDGQIELEVDEESHRAALEALMGTDPTNGCLFYYNPRTATSRWMKDRPKDYTESIGNHIFMK